MKRIGRNVIISSNVKSNDKNDIIVNYHGLINRGYKYFENSTIMLLDLLKRINPSKITIAGFDGFDLKNEENYSDSSFQNERHVEKYERLNKEISIMFREIVDTMTPDCEFVFITPSIYNQ